MIKNDNLLLTGKYFDSKAAEKKKWNSINTKVQVVTSILIKLIQEV